jgi:hypothetical protein
MGLFSKGPGSVSNPDPKILTGSGSGSCINYFGAVCGQIYKEYRLKFFLLKIILIIIIKYTVFFY